MCYKRTALFVAVEIVCSLYALAQNTPVAPTSDGNLLKIDSPRLHIAPPTAPLSSQPAPTPPTTVSSTAFTQAPPLDGPLEQITPKSDRNILPIGPSLRQSIKPVAPGYVIRVGDQLHFRVLDEDDMDYPALLVDKDGTVQIPYINVATVAGKTITQAIDDITKLLRVFYISPIVSIELTTFAPNNYTILGQINNPGVYPLPNQAEFIPLMDALGRAGGTTAIADMGTVVVKRTIDGKEQSIQVDGRPIARGVAGAHFEIHGGDTIIVALSNSQFKVLGDVRNPGIFNLPPLTDNIELSDALAMAGASSADLGEVKIKRIVQGNETVISLDKDTLRRYSRNEIKGDRFFIMSGDAIEVKVAKVTFVVLGQVRSPGIYSLPNQVESISILEALAMAGGATRLADLGSVLVRRKGSEENLKINVKEMEELDAKQVFQVQPEDTITVSERMF